MKNEEIDDLKLALECGMYCSSCWFKTMKMMDEHNDYAKRLLKWVHGGYSNNDQALKRIQKALQKAEDVIRNEERKKWAEEKKRLTTTIKQGADIVTENIKLKQEKKERNEWLYEHIKEMPAYADWFGRISRQAVLELIDKERAKEEPLIEDNGMTIKEFRDSLLKDIKDMWHTAGASKSELMFRNRVLNRIKGEKE